MQADKTYLLSATDSSSSAYQPSSKPDVFLRPPLHSSPLLEKRFFHWLGVARPELPGGVAPTLSSLGLWLASSAGGVDTVQLQASITIYKIQTVANLMFKDPWRLFILFARDICFSWDFNSDLCSIASN